MMGNSGTAASVLRRVEEPLNCPTVQLNVCDRTKLSESG
jgi:hypothetical protein